jgi:precorrin-3B methylase
MDALLSPATIRKKNALVYEEVRDYCESTFDEDGFQQFVDRINTATQDEMPDSVQAAEAVRCVYELSDARKNSIVNWLIESGDKSRYGLACAVAR